MMEERPGGYDLSSIVIYNKSGTKQLTEDDIKTLHCSECSLLLRDPYQLINCGHRICKSCLFDTVLNKNNPVCPEDGEPVGKDDVRLDKGCAKEIKSLTAVCGGSKNGCPWRGTVDEAEIHVESCSYIVVPCPQGCGQKFSRSALNAHIQNDCTNKPDMSQLVATLMQKINQLEAKFQATVGSLQNKIVESDKEIANLKAQLKEVRQLKVKINDFTEELTTFEESTQESLIVADSGRRCAGLDGNGRGGDPWYGSGNFARTTFKEATKWSPIVADSGRRFTGLDDDGGGGGPGYGSGNFVKGQIPSMASSSTSGGFSSVGFGGSRMSSGYSSGDDDLRATVNKLQNDVDHGYSSGRNTISIITSSDRSSPPVLNPGADRVSFNSSVSNSGYSSGDDLRATVHKLQKDVAQMKPCIQDYDVVKARLAGYLEVVQTVQESVTRHAVLMEEVKLRQDILDVKTTNGVFIWKIPEIARRYADAQQRRTLSLYSPPFHASPHGYRMCIRAYLNGDGSGKGTHISVFFVLMKSEHDDLLSWPFKSPVTFQLLNLSGSGSNITEIFMPDLQSPSFQQPRSEMNIASGFPRFAKQSVLKDPNYTKGDAIFIRCKIDLSSIDIKE